MLARIALVNKYWIFMPGLRVATTSNEMIAVWGASKPTIQTGQPGSWVPVYIIFMT
jgi:hypothetical protein